MNHINFDQTGGYRLETESLSKLQTNLKIFEALGDIVGEKSIIKGCNVVGNTTTDGYIYYNGELLEFVGGQTQTTIMIKEDVTDLLFEDGQQKPTFYRRYATFGTGAAQVPWSEFVRAYPLKSALYIDKIDMYAGDPTQLPAGWYLCDGQNGTVDLRQRFIVGYDPADTDYDTVGNTGGLEEVTLTEAQLPSHSHTGYTSTSGEHTHTTQNSNSDGGSGKPATGSEPPEGTGYHTTNPSGNHSHTLNINNTGNDQPHENRPPFYTLAFIQFKGI